MKFYIFIIVSLILSYYGYQQVVKRDKNIFYTIRDDSIKLMYKELVVIFLYTTPVFFSFDKLDQSVVGKLLIVLLSLMVYYTIIRPNLRHYFDKK